MRTHLCFPREMFSDGVVTACLVAIKEFLHPAFIGALSGQGEPPNLETTVKILQIPAEAIGLGSARTRRSAGHRERPTVSPCPAAIETIPPLQPGSRRDGRTMIPLLPPRPIPEESVALRNQRSRMAQLIPLRPNFCAQTAAQWHAGNPKSTRSFGCFRGHGAECLLRAVLNSLAGG